MALSCGGWLVRLTWLGLCAAGAPTSVPRRRGRALALLGVGIGIGIGIACHDPITGLSVVPLIRRSVVSPSVK